MLKKANLVGVLVLSIFLLCGCTNEKEKVKGDTVNSTGAKTTEKKQDVSNDSFYVAYDEYPSYEISGSKKDGKIKQGNLSNNALFWINNNKLFFEGEEYKKIDFKEYKRLVKNEETAEELSFLSIKQINSLLKKIGAKSVITEYDDLSIYKKNIPGESNILSSTFCLLKEGDSYYRIKFVYKEGNENGVDRTIVKFRDIEKVAKEEDLMIIDKKVDIDDVQGTWQAVEEKTSGGDWVTASQPSFGLSDYSYNFIVEGEIIYGLGNTRVTRFYLEPLYDKEKMLLITDKQFNLDLWTLLNDDIYLTQNSLTANTVISFLNEDELITPRPRKYKKLDKDLSNDSMLKKAKEIYEYFDNNIPGYASGVSFEDDEKYKVTVSDDNPDSYSEEIIIEEYDGEFQIIDE